MANNVERSNAFLAPERSTDTTIGLVAHLEQLENQVADLARDRDDARAELAAVRQAIERHDALADAAAKFIRKLDTAGWAKYLPLQVRLALDGLRHRLAAESTP